MENESVKAILVDVISPETSKEEAIKRLEELESLLETYGGVVAVKVIQKRDMPDYETYIGKGKVHEIFCEAEEQKAEVVIVNNILKPRQIYNLEQKLKKGKIKVWDRIDLILKIFAKHAKSSEAKLQIQLASIRHMGPRIFGMGEELMQQTGAVGLRGGAGETNIEMMKRHLRNQEQNIVKKLAHYETVSAGHRERRRRRNLKTVALVGYTNAGKSSLLKALTGKDVYIANELFATLSTRVGKLYVEPSSEQIELASKEGRYLPGQEILVSDTIGFIQDLPPELIKAFKSTLEETVEADLLLHVIDISDPYLEMKIQVVEEILDQLGIRDLPKIYVFNKIDLIDHSSVVEAPPPLRIAGMVKAGQHASKLLGWMTKEDQERRKKLMKRTKNPRLLARKYHKFSPVFVSANDKLNLDKLIGEIEKGLGR